MSERLRHILRVTLAAAAVAFVLSGLAADTGYAQNPPFTAYGAGSKAVTPGDSIEAFAGGVSCATATADAAGEWVLEIAESAACAPKAGTTITFTLNGQATIAAESWSSGGVPADIAEGVSLTLSVTPPAAPAADAFMGALPAAGAFGLLVTARAVTPDDLAASIEVGGCSVTSLAVVVQGAWVIFAPGAPAVVNAKFPPSLATMAPFLVRC